MQQQEFIKIIKQHEGIIYKITHVYSDTVEDKKDLYQEIVFQLWKSVHSFKEQSKLSTWMYRVALNTAVTHIKKKQKQHTVALDFELPLLNDGNDRATDDKFKLLHQQINSLNKVEKGIILLYLEGKKYDEIATITGFSKTNVGTRLNRIKEKIKNNIKD